MNSMLTEYSRERYLREMRNDGNKTFRGKPRRVRRTVNYFSVQCRYNEPKITKRDNVGETSARNTTGVVALATFRG